MKAAMPQITPEFIIDLVVRRRWMIMLPLSLTLLAGICLAVILPKVYEAKTLILVEGQRVPQSYVQSIVTTETSERISTISQQITSRTNLEKIIRDFGLFTEPDQQNVFIEDKLENLRRRIEVNVIRGGRETQAFEISFKDNDPQKVMNVANGLATYFIDENLKVRESQAMGTSQFLDSELETMRLRLEQVEESIKDYRKSNMGELPEQLQSNLQILGRFQEDLTNRQQSLREAKIRLAELSSTTATREPSVVIIGGNQTAQPDGVSIEELNLQLERLQSRYTEKHPDILRLKKQIAEQEGKANLNSAQQGTAAPSRHIPPEIRRQMAEVQREIQLTEREIEQLRTQIAEYNRRVESTPKREQELLGLRRDYENISTTYESLLGRKLEAEIAVNMERKQKGEQFRIVDPARLPQKPVSPNLKKLFLAVIAAGLGMGGGIALLLEVLKPSFRKPAEIESEYGLAVIGVIPRLLQPKQIFLARLNVAASIAFSSFIFGLLAIVAFIASRGTEPLMKAAKLLMMKFS